MNTLGWQELKMVALAVDDLARAEDSGKPWRQKPQKYHAKSLDALRAKFAAVKSDRTLAGILERANVHGLSA